MIWEVKISYNGVFVFYFTENDLKNYCNSTFREDIKKQYFTDIKIFDELNLVTLGSINFYFDSKERVDREYRGNLFLYFRSH